LPFDDSAAEVYGEIRSSLEKKSRIIGPNDLIIASIAKANDLILITHNGKEFNRVEGLTVEDWQE
jgi:tRNA(fMet)-specific endonuclease VapC